MEGIKCDGNCEECDKNGQLMDEFLAVLGVSATPDELLSPDSEIIKLNLEVSKTFAKIVQRFVIIYGKEGGYELFLDTFLSLLFNESLIHRMQNFAEKGMPEFLEHLAENNPKALETLSRISLKTAFRTGKGIEILEEVKEILKKGGLTNEDKTRSEETSEE